MSIESDAATTQTITVEGNALSIDPIVAVSATVVTFDETEVNQTSEVVELVVNANNLDSAISVEVSDNV